MSSTTLPTHPPRGPDSDEVTDFLTWLFRDHPLSIETRVRAAQELLQLVQDEAYHRGLAAPHGSGHVAGNTETRAAIDVAWERMLRSAGKALPRHSSSRRHFARKDLKALAKFIAIVVRNAMEDFHVKHLSDVQMKELNPLIRNAVFSALDAWSSMDRSDRARKWVEHQSLQIPKYWEEPKLLTAYVRSIKASDGTPANSADDASAVNAETP